MNRKNHNTESSNAVLHQNSEIPGETIEKFCRLLERAVELYAIPLQQSVKETVIKAMNSCNDSDLPGSSKENNRSDTSDSSCMGDNDGIFFFSAPGRVNLIGEHTDYNNCPVLPVAVNCGILAIAIPNDKGIVCVDDLNPEYSGITFNLDEYVASDKGVIGDKYVTEQEIRRRKIPPFETGHWGNYIKAAVNELLGTDYPLKKGYSMVFSSTIPQAAGMSSSSAMVVLSALIFMEVNGIAVREKPKRLMLAELCGKAEWYVGTMGGGMDQAAILLGKEGCVSRIDFNPLQVREVPFPQDYTIIVTHSTIEAPKTRRAMDQYNRRSIECRIATAIASEAFRKLYGVDSIHFIGDITPAKTGLTKEQINQALPGLFHTGFYTLDESANLMGKTASFVKENYCIRKDGSDFPIPEEGLKLYQRFHHVWSEWERVEQSAELLEYGDMKEFGRLMDESHQSCLYMHEISCTELDRLTELAREAGALGSSLTGAGFGGCAVSLVMNRNVTSFIRQIRRVYYHEYLGIPEEETEKYIFPVRPVKGAGVVGQLLYPIPKEPV